MWDKDDHFARWVHGLCGIPVAAFVVFDVHLLLSDYAHDSRSNYQSTGLETALIGAVYLLGRLLWYAITGSNNINRDDFD